MFNKKVQENLSLFVCVTTDRDNMTLRQTPKIMKCGCAANAKCDKFQGVEYKPAKECCLHHMCFEEAEEQPNIEGRFARCSYYRTCKTQVASNFNLAFFSYRPEKEFDDFFCGCKGWD